MAALQKPYPDATEDPNRFLPYIPKTMRYNPAKDLRVHGRRSDKEFTEERIWLIEHLQDPNETKVGVVGAAIPGEPESSGKGKGKEKFTEEEDDAPLEDGTGIECQCCFSEYAFVSVFCCISFRLSESFHRAAFVDILRIKWYNAQKRIFSAAVVCPSMPQRNWGNTILPSYACTHLVVLCLSPSRSCAVYFPPN